MKYMARFWGKDDEKCCQKCGKDEDNEHLLESYAGKQKNTWVW